MYELTISEQICLITMVIGGIIATVLIIVGMRKRENEY